MDFGVGDILEIAGALAFFVYGMKMMSDGIQRAAGSQLRNILRTMTKNRYLGVFTGFLTTALVQSSSATTVMTVSFVNAGLLSLVESAGVMMGANIGTTITGWIISILGFKIKLNTLSIPIFAFAIPMLFSKKGKLKYWGEFLIGFAILFLGLGFLKASVPDIGSNPGAMDWLKGFAEYGILSRIFFVFLGAIVTVIVQSSSAAMTITLTLVYTGWLPLDIAAAMILGENIGTTITAEIASLVGNVHAKRSARIHSMFNIIGVTWMVIALPWVIGLLDQFVQNFSGLFEGHVEVGAELDAVNTINTYKLAAFHTVFNLLNVVLLLPFVPWLVKTAVWSVKSKKEDDEDIRLTFIKGASRTPELATVELQKEIAHFGEVVSRMLTFCKDLVNSVDNKERDKLYDKMAKYEEISDNMETEVTEYITALSNEEITPRTSLRLRSILNISNDLERIGDVFFQVSKTIERKNDQKLYFDEYQRGNLNAYILIINKAFETMITNLKAPNYDKVSIESAITLEQEINDFRNKLRKENLTKIGTKDYNVKSAMVYNNVFSSLEKVGDHIMNVNESIVGQI